MNAILSNFRISGTFSLMLVTALMASVLFISTANSDSDNIAIEGYDTVAYFMAQRATRGSKDISYQWNGLIWYFSSIENKKQFIADPKKFAPQFNGFCANGLSDGHAIEANPENWRIIDGKLYLFFSDYGRSKWSGNVKPLIESANETLKNQ